MSFSHLDADRRPTMVDVSDKTATKRTAVAEARVHFPAAVAAALRDSGLRSSKGPIFDTAIVAGVMGAKVKLLAKEGGKSGALRKEAP
jgi:cyclic pyranopterin monophosphate synthase